MKLATFFHGLEVHRDDRFVSLRFPIPHRVLSTCPAHGGLVDGLDMVFNHQCCEPVRHQMESLMTVYRRADLYQALVMDVYGQGTAVGAGLGTAANMRNLAMAEESHQDIAVVAIATGGVEGNAARAGDPASYYEYDGTFQKRGDIGPDSHGTINLMVAVNTPLTEGALVRAVMMATEAKTALLQELSVPSRQSSGLATGTGTDQMAIAAPACGSLPLSNAGHHAVLGELIGKAVKRALRETLERQNLLTAIRQCSCSFLLERFGLKDSDFIERVATHLPDDLAELARLNRHVLERDPLVVAAAIGLIHVHDQMGWGTIPAPCRGEAMANHGAQVAAALSGDYSRYPQYRISLAQSGFLVPDAILAYAVALGFKDKWTAFGRALDDHAGHMSNTGPA